MTLEEALAIIAKTEETLKANGFSTVADMVADHQKVCAERDKAVEARDKFSSQAEEAQKVVRDKAGEIGALKQEVEQLKTTPTAEPPAGDPPPATTPPATPAAPAKSDEEALAEVEASMSDEDWERANGYLEHMEDEEAIACDKNAAVRLKFLRDVKAEAAAAPATRPTTLKRTPNTPNEPAASDADIMAALKKRLGGKTPGPDAPAPRKGGKGKNQDTKEAKWLR